MEPYEILLKVINPRSAFMVHLQTFNEDISNKSLTQVALALKVLVKVACCSYSDEHVNQFLRQVLTTPFVTKRLPQLVSRELLAAFVKKEWTAEDVNDCLRNLIGMMLACFQRMPNASYDRLHLMVESIRPFLLNLMELDEQSLDPSIEPMREVSS